MKILFQYYSGGGGALENIMVLLTRLANDYPNDELIIVCNSSSKLNQLAYIKNISIITPKEFYHKELTRLQLGFWGLKSIVRKVKPDIVWSMNLGSYVKLKPVNLLSIHNSHQVYPLKDTISHPKNRLHVLIMRFFFRLSLKVSDRVLTQTEVVKSYVHLISPMKEISIFTKVVEDEKDVTLVNPPPFVLGKLNKIRYSNPMLYVATNYQHKNHKVIIEALSILVKNGKEASLILSLSESEAIGIGGSVAASLIESNHLCCIGWVDKSWLRYLYDLAFICLMPSTLESLSSSHLEAMAWKVPQISSDLPFAQETCRDASLYCAPDNVNSWCKKIIELFENPELYEELQQKGLLRLKEFPKDWREVAKNYHEMFVHELTNKG